MIFAPSYDVISQAIRAILADEICRAEVLGIFQFELFTPVFRFEFRLKTVIA